MSVLVEYTPENEKYYLVEQMGGGGTRGFPPTIKGGLVHGFPSEADAISFLENYELGNLLELPEQ